MAGWDTSRYLSLFVGEAGEHLDALGKDLVRLEQKSGEPAPLVDSMFRHAHSVKGMAASMGFASTTTLAHRLEDLLHALRSDLSRFDEDLGDVVLKAVDALGTHVRAAAANEPFPEPGPLLEQLAQATRALEARPPSGVTAAGQTSSPSPAPAAPSPVPAAEAPRSSPSPAPAASSSSVSRPADELELPALDVQAGPRFELRLRVSPTTTQPGVRAFLAYKRLSAFGAISELKPPMVELKAGRIPDGVFTLALDTDESEGSIKKTLKTVAEVELEGLKVVPRPVRAAPREKQDSDTGRHPGLDQARTVRVRTELLDEFLDAAGELLLATARVREVSKDFPEGLRPPLDEAVDRLHGLVKDLHGKVMKARMTPLALITDRLPRAVRDIARRRGREVELTITGADIELDRAIVDELADPMLHLVRNAIDHGVEPPEERRMRGKSPRGRITISVRRARDAVLVEVQDDGRGIDVERLKQAAVDRGVITAEQARELSQEAALMLCCHPGVSTASDITDISGRGVGMDAVKRAVESVGGSLDIESSRGKGTTFRLALPLTVAVVNLLLVGVGDEVFGLPIAKVTGVVQTARESMASAHDEPVLHFGQTVVPVHELGRLLEVPSNSVVQKVSPFVVLEGDDGPLALGVDSLLGQQEVVLKALGRPLDLVPGLAGVTILGNGRPVFILDVPRLVPA